MGGCRWVLQAVAVRARTRGACRAARPAALAAAPHGAGGGAGWLLGAVAAPAEDMDDVIDVMSLTSSRSDGDEPEYEVEAIRKMVREDGAAQFLVKWKGYDEETWEPEENLTSCKDLLDEFLDKLGSNEAAACGSDEDEPEYEVEAIRKMVREDGVPKFLVKWKGYGDEDNTWSPRDIPAAKTCSTSFSTSWSQ